MKKKMFALAFGLLLAFGSQGQFAEELPPADGGTSYSPPSRECLVRSANVSEGFLIVDCLGVGAECVFVHDCVKGGKIKTIKP
jgi:hypothetical protein